MTRYVLMGSPGIEIDEIIFKRSERDVQEFVKELLDASGKTAQVERRQHPRYPIKTPILLMPLNDEFAPAGNTIEAVIRDVSIGGICFFSSKNVKHKFAAVEFKREDRRLKAIVRVLRVQNFNGIFNVAGKFVATFRDAVG